MVVFNWVIFAVIALATAIPWCIFVRKQTVLVKLPITMAMISIFVYSGIGLSWNADVQGHVFEYCVYVFFFCASFMFVLAKEGKYLQRRITIENRDNDLTKSLYLHKNLYSIFTAVFFLCYISYLIVPEFRIMDLFIPKAPSLPLKLARVRMYNAIPLFSLVDTLITFLTPFFLLLIQCELRIGKKGKSLILLCLWVYLDYCRYSYLGRNEFVFYMVFIFFAIFNYEGEQIAIKKGLIFLSVVAAVMIIPFLYSFTFTRQGNAIQDSLTFIDSFWGLLRTETYYPQYYNTISDAAGMVRPIDFLLWIIFMPIPSILWPGKPAVVVNDVFTLLVTGKVRGQLGFSIELPSLLGEAIFVFGSFGYVIHAIVIAAIIALVFKTYLKYKPMRMLYIYYASLILIIGRGGTGSFLPELVNGSVSVLIWLALLGMMGRRRRE